MPMEDGRDMYLPGPDHPDTVSGGVRSLGMYRPGFPYLYKK